MFVGSVALSSQYFLTCFMLAFRWMNVESVKYVLVYMYVCVYIYICVCVCVCMNVRMYVCMYVRTYIRTQLASHCYFLRKWRNDSCSGIASNFARSLAIAKWKPFGRFSGFSATMPWTSHKLRSTKTDSKMAARRWRSTLVPVGPQQAEMTSSLTKCGLWSCRTVVSPSKNLRRRWG